MAELAADECCAPDCCAPSEKDACCSAAGIRVCALDERGLAAQLARYRAAGEGARLIERTGRRLKLEVADRVGAGQVEELIAVERACCPFFAIEWQPGSRRLSISVAEGEHEPALDAIASALGII